MYTSIIALIFGIFAGSLMVHLLISSFSKKRVTPEFQIAPQIGELWIFKEPDADPWAAPPHQVLILDVKEGWVKYEFNPNIEKTFKTMPGKKKISDFVKMYNLYKVVFNI
jgi:hypothetical protein